MGYDIIGDIHGYADTLEELLGRLGYEKSEGTFQHPERRVIFVGDFVDRGPKIRETLHLVRAMVDGGSALAVMGNHELNAIFYHHRGPDGRPLRLHTESNQRQHRATLDQLAVPHPREWAEWLEWFKTLPFYLDLGNLRVVHAAWKQESIDFVKGASLRDSVFLQAAAIRGLPEYEAIETLLKGVEMDLPEGVFYADKEGHRRHRIRVRWFGHGVENYAPTYPELVLPASDDLPEMEVAAERLAELPNYPAEAPPVFFGHYWLPASHRACLAPNAACVDFSVAKAGGALAAYRWDGESVLEEGKVVKVERR